MTTLVTGGLGYVGSHFVWAAHESGRRVVVLDDSSAGTSPTLPDGVTVVKGDVGDATATRELLARHGVREIVHFAGLIQVGESVREPGRYFDVNFVRALRLLEAAAAAGIERFVFSSTATAFGMRRRATSMRRALTRVGSSARRTIRRRTSSPSSSMPRSESESRSPSSGRTTRPPMARASATTSTSGISRPRTSSLSTSSRRATPSAP